MKKIEINSLLIGVLSCAVVFLSVGANENTYTPAVGRYQISFTVDTTGAIPIYYVATVDTVTGRYAVGDYQKGTPGRWTFTDDNYNPYNPLLKPPTLSSKELRTMSSSLPRDY